MFDPLESAQQAAASAAETAQTAASSAQQAAEQATNSAQEAAASAQSAAQEAASSAQETAEQGVAAAQEAASSAQAAAEEAASSAQSTIEEATASAQSAAEEAANSAQAAGQEAAATAQAAAGEAQAAASEAASSAQAAAERGVAAAQEMASSAQSAAESAAAQAQSAAADAAGAAESVASSAQEAVEGAVDSARSAAEETVASAQQRAQQAADQAQGAAEQAAAEAQAAVENGAAQAQAAAAEAVAAAEQAAAEAQAAAEEAMAQAQEAVEQAAAAVQEEAQEAVEAAQAAAEEAAATLEEAAEDAVAAAEEAAAEAQAALEEGVAAAEAAAAEAQAAVEEAAAAAEQAAAQAQAAAEEAAAAAEAMAEQAQAAAEEAVAAVEDAVAQAQAAAQEAMAAAQGMAEEAQAAAQEALAMVEEAAAEALAAAEEAAAMAQEMAAEALAAAEEAAAALQEALGEALDAAQGLVEDALSSVAGVFGGLPGLGFGSQGRPDQDVLISQFVVKLGGNLAPEAFMRDVIEILVDDSLYLPDMFTIHLQDKSLQWIDSDLVSIGTEVEILAKSASAEQSEGGDRESSLLIGEITALEPDFSLGGESTLLVRGYDRAHRLNRGKQTRSFLQAKDSEIVEKIAQEVQLRSETDPTNIIYDYVFQNNQTNWEFLLERAQRSGYKLYVEDETLYFRSGDSAPETGPELEWGKNLRTFKPRLTVAHQVNEVVVKGWDPVAKREIVGRASESNIVPDVGVPQAGGPLAQQAFQGAAQAVVVNHPVWNQDEAQAMAQALCDEINGEFIQAEGVCTGEPTLQSGKKIRLTALGERFSGTYVVTSATHTYSAKIGYETAFTISGRLPETLSQLLLNGNSHDRSQGVVIGLVTNNKDPDGLGRVKVKYPWLADNEESSWARIATPMAGQGRGFYYLPEINDEVLMAFEHGDVHRPYVLGVLWNGKDTPPKKNDQVVGGDGKVNQRILHSRSGHQIILDDTDGSEKIEVIDSSGNNSIVISSSDNTMTITANAKITVEAGGQTLVLDNNGQSIELKGGGRSIKLSGGQVQMT